MTQLTPFVLLPETHSDERGDCVVYGSLPFVVVRQFNLESVPDENVKRGKHHHKSCWQSIQAVSGRASLITERDGTIRFWDLCPGKQIVVPPGWNVTLHRFTSNCVVSVLCSEPYSPDEVIAN
jgi:oxalate decarboxylase/phosphoglucose isomerase-like protein (cupin superfamily)